MVAKSEKKAEEKREDKELEALRAKYYQALSEGTPQNKPWGGLPEPERREVQAEYNKFVAES